MTVIINRTTSRQEFSAIINKMYQPKKTLNAQKFCGKVKFDKDPLILQRIWRDEW